MAQGQLLWYETTDGDLLAFDPGSEYETSSIHIYKKTESITLKKAKSEIEEADSFPYNVDKLPRKSIARQLLKVRSGKEPSLTWNVDS